MTPRVLRPNRGQSVWRQRLAPQPDSGVAGGRPMDYLARHSPRSLAGPNFPVPAPFRQGGQGGQTLHGQVNGQQSPMGGGGGGLARDFRDRLNPNGDQPVQLTPIQRAWLQKNLGVQGRHGLSQYIRGAGGVDPFMQMLQAMPGWGRASAGMGPGGHQPQGQQPHNGQTVHGSVNGQQSPVPGQVVPGGHQPPPVQNQMFPEQAAQYAPQSEQHAPTSQSQQQQPTNSATPRRQAQSPTPSESAPLEHGMQPPRTPQEHGLRLASDPHYLASTMAYRGATDPKEREKQDHERFARHGLPLTPEVVAGMGTLTDQYIQALIAQGYSEADAAAYVNIQKERLAQNFSIEQSRTDEQAAESGILGSGVQQQMQTDLSTDYGRQFQDLALQAAQQDRQFADQRAALLEALRSGRLQLTLQQAQQLFGDAAGGNPFTGLNTAPRHTRHRSRRRSERERG